MWLSFRLLLLVLSGLLAGCAASVLPASLQLQVDRTLAFAQLKDSPDSYRGRLVIAGGEVLSAKRLKEGTRVTIVGEVTGATTLPLDETDYAYPTLEIKHLKVWPMRDNQTSRPGSYSGPAWHPSYGPWYRYYYWR
jgi:outer membrane lipoprotein